MFNEHNSWMILGLANILTNKGVLTEKEHKDIFDLGNHIEETIMIGEAKNLVNEIKDILNKE